MATLPTHLIKLRVLAEIPRSQYLDLSGPEDSLNEKSRLDFFRRLRKGGESTVLKADNQRMLRGNREMSFDVAVWLKFMIAPKKPVSLWLLYEDQRGENLVLVDEQKFENRLQSMLSGNVNFKVEGSLNRVKAACAGIGDNEVFAVEELMVQRKQRREQFNTGNDIRSVI